ncbi:MAG: lipopolysaccharide heptosyltransferase I [Candidatus Thiothrix moscowensis]|nr:lipopolysaccharide heptosyltransferase I [Candidatus Thiothrix moscowensis]
MSQTPRLLVVKTSSLGDVVHMLPAVSDACAMLPGIQIDWVVEESFAEVPRWHPGVRRVVPVALRRWHKQLLQPQTRHEIRRFVQTLRQEQYDWVLDSQGLLKSALLSRMARGQRCGYDWHSIREPLASLAYQQRAAVSRQQHAVTRNRLLTANMLGYRIDSLPVDFGIAASAFPLPPVVLPSPYVVALHGTSRVDKEWAEEHWRQLIATLAQQGIHTLLPWGNQREQERASRLAQTSPFAQVLPRCRLAELAGVLQAASGVIGMDTGLMHIAAALDKPGIALYPATAPALTGVMGNAQQSVQLVSLSGEASGDAASVICQLLACVATRPSPDVLV